MTQDTEQDDLPEEDRALISSDAAPATLYGSAVGKPFAPWHHPVKQIVREQQWAELTRKLIGERQFPSDILRYFTLPGPDLFDIRVLSDVCVQSNIKIEYFGFLDGGASGEEDDDGSPRAPWASAEAALRQSGRITANSEIAGDRLEDIAIERSKARSSLNQRQTFDVINLDGCGYLAHQPKNRTVCTFDALRALLAHQSKATSPWLLFLTTRADAQMLGTPGAHLQNAILQNLTDWPDSFGCQLAETMGWPFDTVASSITTAWSSSGMSFMQIFTLGVSKFLLKHFHQQRELQADVRLKSSYVYRVKGEDVDMAALAFLISPDPAPPPTRVAGGGAPQTNPEPGRACSIVRRIGRVWNIDEAIQNDSDLKARAVSGTEALLKIRNYDIVLWREWVTGHEIRPLPIS